MNQGGQIRIGTSNVVLPGNKTSFPGIFQSKSRLHYYSHLFNTVELNSSFYKTPMPSTIKKWVLDVPEDFQFTLKLSKTITHSKDLSWELSCMEKFMVALEATGQKKGCMLVQFPGKISLDHFAKVEDILETIDELDAGQQWRKAVEFRNASWYLGETYELLDQFNATMVLHDIPKARLSEVRGNSPFIYLRFHGPKGDYRGSYTDDRLEANANEITEWTKQGKDVYAYFNNTAGDAFNNAVRLKELLNS